MSRDLMVRAGGMAIAFAVAGSAQAAQTAAADVVDNTVFLKNTDSRWAALPIILPLARDILRAIPSRDGASAMLELKCADVTPRGRLARCAIRVEPVNMGYEQVGQAAVRTIRIDPAHARSLQNKVRFLYVQLRLSRSVSPPWNGPCWPPSCAMEPAPPPPPPATLQNSASPLGSYRR